MSAKNLAPPVSPELKWCGSKAKFLIVKKRIINALAAAGVRDAIIPIADGGLDEPVNFVGPQLPMEDFRTEQDPDDPDGPRIPILNDAGNPRTDRQAREMYMAWYNHWHPLYEIYRSENKAFKAQTTLAVGIIASYLSEPALDLVITPFLNGRAREMWEMLVQRGTPTQDQGLQKALEALDDIEWREGNLTSLEARIKSARDDIAVHPGQGVETEEKQIARVVRLVREAHEPIFANILAALAIGNNGVRFPLERYWSLLNDTEETVAKGDVWAYKRRYPLKYAEMRPSRRMTKAHASRAEKGSSDDESEPLVIRAATGRPKAAEASYFKGASAATGVGKRCIICNGKHLTAECNSPDMRQCPCGWKYHKREIGQPCKSRAHDRKTKSKKLTGATSTTLDPRHETTSSDNASFVSLRQEMLREARAAAKQAVSLAMSEDESDFSDN